MTVEVQLDGSGGNRQPRIRRRSRWKSRPTVVESALSVPVTALVGKSGGGFAVEVVRAGGRRELVAVKLGLFDTAGGRVQVEGDLHEGDQVVVPSL